MNPAPPAPSPVEGPPRFALSLLTFVSDDEPLVGDLVEQYQSRPSRFWFWWQVLGAIAVAFTRGPREIRPLHLVDGPGPVLGRVSDWRERRPINLTGSPVHGVGGLGLVALASIVTVTAPGTWWIVLAVLLGGVLVGLARLAVSHQCPRRLRDQGPFHASSGLAASRGWPEARPHRGNSASSVQ